MKLTKSSADRARSLTTSGSRQNSSVVLPVLASVVEIYLERVAAGRHLSSDSSGLVDTVALLVLRGEGVS